MSVVLKDTVVNIGTSPVLVLPANSSRQSLQIQNKHATQTLLVKTGSNIIGTDVTQVQTISFSPTPNAGNIVLGWNGNNSAGIVTTDNAAAVQTKLRAVTGLSTVTVAGSFAAGFAITMTGVTPQVFASDPALSIISNSLNVSAVVEVQKISFGAVPDAGSFNIHNGANVTGSILSSAVAADVQTAVRTLPGFSSATVTGDFTAGFTITFTGLVGPQPLLTVVSNMTSSSVPVVVTVTEMTPGSALVNSVPTLAITTPGQYADGYFVAAANGTLSFSGQGCPIDAIYMQASGSNTRVEILQG